MSRWEEEKAERNRRSLGRLTTALPCIFPSAVLSRARVRPHSCWPLFPTDRHANARAHVWSHDNSGMRRVITPDFCGACKHGAAVKAADGCRRAPKLIIASRCFGSGANFGMRLGPSCLAVGITKPSGDQSRRSRRKNAQPKRKIAAPRAILLQNTPDRVSARNAAARLTSTNAADPRRCAQQ
jgi:hypothetical protein